jgi:hypothetical protein
MNQQRRIDGSTVEATTARLLDDPFAAGAQAAKDAAAFAKEDVTAVRGLASGIGAIGSVAGAIAGAGSLGASLAGAVKAVDALEIELVNFSSLPVVVFNYFPKVANVTKVPRPLVRGGSDIFLITHRSKFNTNETSIELFLKVGISDVSVKYALTGEGDPGRWRVSFGVDGNVLDAPNRLQLFGVTAVRGEQKFSMYTSPIEEKSGQIGLAFYDLVV